MLNLKNNRGIILIVVYLIISVLLAFSVAFISRTINEKNIALRQKNIAEAFYLAESGLDAGLNWLRGQEDPPTGINRFAPDIPSPDCNVGVCDDNLAGTVCQLGGGAYCISIDPDNTNTAENPQKRYVITSIGTVGDITRRLVNDVQTGSFSMYSWFTNAESFVWRGRRRMLFFIGSDRMEGPVRTNSHFAMMNNPEFAGPVSSLSERMAFYNNGSPRAGDVGQTTNPPNDVPVYGGGVTLGVDRLELPTDSPELADAAAAAGFALQGRTTVVLNADGTMNVTNSARGWDNENMPLPSTIYVGEAEGEGEGGGTRLIVSGTLANGQLTLGSRGDIEIVNSVTYADSDSILGLIASRDVLISRDAPYDVEVDASIMALNGSFVVEGWDTGLPRGTLRVFGGIVQRNRGPIGMADMTGDKTSGYSRDYDYDDRLGPTPPPYFPVTGDYISLSWKD